MTSNFISHSKHDMAIVDYFSKAFGRAGLTLQLMELEDLKNKYAGFEITNTITNESGGVSVLLGRNLLYPPTMNPEFTHNWVNFEVGVAAGTGKRVWIFEDYQQNIRFPIPYVTDYVQYNLGSAEHLRTIGDILKENLTANMSNAPIIKCPHSSCNAVYYYWGAAQQIYCPVCRQSIPKYEERPDRLKLSNVT